jgi:photosystem II stability/assembly factor-like uncharacterized protein
MIWKRVALGQEFLRDRLTALVIDPNDAEVLYAGTTNAGIFKSIDGGISWQPIHAGLGGAAVYSLVIDPEETSTLFAGLVDAGVYRTSDGGRTWVLSQAARPGWWAGAVAMDPHDHRHLIYSEGISIYRTTDSGAAWTEIGTQGPFSLGTTDVAISPFDGRTLFGAVWSIGLFRSPGDVRIWEKVLPEDGISRIWASPHPDGDMWIASQGMWRSADSGETWTKTDLSDCQVIGFDPNDPKLEYCGGGLLYRSQDQGQTWQLRSRAPGEAIAAIAPSPADPDTLFAGARGILLSEDGGLTWAELGSGLGATRLELEILPNQPDRLILSEIGTEQVWRIFVSTDSGRSWELLAADRGHLLSQDAAGDRMYLSSQNGELLSSGDGGITWRAMGTAGDGQFTYMAHPHEPGVLFALPKNAGGSILMSRNYGSSWLRTSGSFSFCGNPRFFFDHDQGQVIYAANDCSTYVSLDAGETWGLCVENPLGTSPTVSRLAIDPRDSRRIYLAASAGGILVSETGCTAWSEGGTRLESLQVNSLAIDPTDPDTIYAGTDGGAYVSFDRAASWQPINDGLLGATVVYSIVVDEQSNVFASTPYGIFLLENR